MFLYRTTLKHNSGFYGETEHQFRHIDDMTAEAFAEHCRESLAEATRPGATPPALPDEDPIALVCRRFEAAMGEYLYRRLEWTEAPVLTVA
jgi:hypothetical protein